MLLTTRITASACLEIEGFDATKQASVSETMVKNTRLFPF